MVPLITVAEGRLVHMVDGYCEWVCERRGEILRRIARAAARAGRDPRDVELVAVSKTVGVEEVVAAIGAGYRRFGENRPQELGRKLSGLAGRDDLPAVSFDMIGNLQTNKINSVLGRVGLIHSVSSLHLAQAVSSRAARALAEGRLAAEQDILLEVNVSGEESKSGFAPDELRRALPELLSLPGVRIRGLMTMAPRGNAATARRTFAGLRALRDELRDHDEGIDLAELSCGMSEDFECAVEEGSTIVRLGRVVFDPAFELE